MLLNKEQRIHALDSFKKAEINTNDTEFLRNQTE